MLFAAFTGKAACVMRSKGCRGASTIHSLIYKPLESNEEQPSFELWNDAPASKAKLIIIDECSMVDAELARDLTSFGVPLLVLGDPAQLPPIQGGGFFTDAEPDAMLTEVHRQARDNPIVRLSMDIRAGKALAPGQYGETQVVRRAELDPKRVLGADQVLVGRNVTRRAYNARLRERRGFAEPLPMAGDKLVCLRNNRRKGLFNGGLWVVKEAPKARRQILRMRLKPDEELGEPDGQGVGAAGMLHRRHRGSSSGRSANTTTSSTSATCSPCTRRKARNGTTWCCSTSSRAFTDSRDRWLYTGVTRAAKRLTVVV